MKDLEEIIARAIHAKMHKWRVAKTMTHYEYEEYEPEWLELGRTVAEAIAAAEAARKGERRTTDA